MKRKLIFWLCVILCLVGSGCANKKEETKDNTEDVKIEDDEAQEEEVQKDEAQDDVIELTEEEKIVESISKNFDESDLLAYQVECPELLNAVDMVCYELGTNDFCLLFITEDGSLYELSLTGMYSNDKCYKKIESSCKFLRFCSVGSHYLLGDDGVLYDFNGETFSAHEYVNYSEDNAAERERMKTSAYLTKHSELWIFKGDKGKILYNHAITGGGKYVYEEQKELRLPNNESVEWFSDNTVKTNANWYYFKEICINEEDAEKYIDVEKEYDIMLKVIDMSDDIIFFKIDTYFGPIAIDSNGTFYCSEKATGYYLE